MHSKLLFYFIYIIHSTIETWNEWQDNPTITTINTTAYPIQNIEFPAITICSQGTAKDLMDKVILNQFEAYLRARGIKPETNATDSATTSTGKRRKRSTEKRISETLPAEKVRVGHIKTSIVIYIVLLFFEISITCHIIVISL